jgi:hypothetical protein
MNISDLQFASQKVICIRLYLVFYLDYLVFVCLSLPVCQGVQIRELCSTEASHYS